LIFKICMVIECGQQQEWDPVLYGMGQGSATAGWASAAVYMS
jgi:hypothetical protein